MGTMKDALLHAAEASNMTIDIVKGKGKREAKKESDERSKGCNGSGRKCSSVRP